VLLPAHFPFPFLLPVALIAFASPPGKRGDAQEKRARYRALLEKLPAGAYVQRREVDIAPAAASLHTKIVAGPREHWRRRRLSYHISREGLAREAERARVATDSDFIMK
jgi:hypothetical protein